jgi:hypothetical protein
MDPVRPFRGLAVLGREEKVVGDVNAPYDEDAAFPADLTPRNGLEPAFAGRYPARLQRAAEGSRQSTGGRRHQVVEGGGVALVGTGL